MALAPYKASDSRRAKSFTYPSGSTDPLVVPVTPGNRISLSVGDPQGGTYNVINYKFTEEEDTNRLLNISESNLTAVYSKTSLGGFVQIGLQFTVAPSADVRVEVLEGDF